jgi:hypothetical protein
VIRRCEYMSRGLLILLSSVLVMSSVASTAAEGYDPDEFLNLDLSKAALSPKPLGPANRFGSVPVKARADNDVAGPHAHARSAPDHVRTAHVRTERVRTAHATAQKPRGTARTRLALRHHNPLDAQAMVTRIQVWPCKSGGICKWKR